MTPYVAHLNQESYRVGLADGRPPPCDYSNLFDGEQLKLEDQG